MSDAGPSSPAGTPSTFLLVFQLYDQQGNVPVCITPILMLDM